MVVPKLKGRTLRDIPGTDLRVYYRLKPAKTAKGHDRLWLHVRHTRMPKRWRTSTVLAYPRGLDVAFMKEKV
jgi:hypothetical protein